MFKFIDLAFNRLPSFQFYDDFIFSFVKFASQFSIFLMQFINFCNEADFLLEEIKNLIETI